MTHEIDYEYGVWLCGILKWLGVAHLKTLHGYLFGLRNTMENLKA
jgi:hypothetical protein